MELKKRRKRKFYVCKNCKGLDCNMSLLHNDGDNEPTQCVFNGHADWKIIKI